MPKLGSSGRAISAGSSKNVQIELLPCGLCTWIESWMVTMSPFWAPDHAIDLVATFISHLSVG
jgi:hypothetical protein